MRKIAYLTIDDGPSKTTKIKARFLLSNSIPAIWFCRGNLIEKRMAEAIYLIKKGFIIGNHSYSHPRFSNLTLKKCYDEIRATDCIIEKIYKQAGIRRDRKYFRFPYGDKGGKNRAKLQALLRSVGYRQPNFKRITYRYYRKSQLLGDADWYWTYDTMDWCVSTKTPMYGINTWKKVYARMDEDYPEAGRGLNFPRSEDIILMHDELNSVMAFKSILFRLIGKGIKFKAPP